MDRFLGSKRVGSAIFLEKEELRHLFAKRLRVGQELEVFVEDKLYLCVLEKLTKGYASCLIKRELCIPTPFPLVHLYQCVPVELKNMDLIVEKVSEVGAFRLVPVVSDRSFQNAQVINKRLERWKRIALTSFKQCRRPKPLEIDQSIDLKDLRADAQLNLLLDSFEREKSLRDLRLNGVEVINLVVGPEGGLTIKESTFLKSVGFLPVRLYPYTLRSETASILGVGILMNFSTPSSPTCLE